LMVTVAHRRGVAKQGANFARFVSKSRDSAAFFSIDRDHWHPFLQRSTWPGY
jgi:hypothetical protein